MSIYFKECEKNMVEDFLAKLDNARVIADMPFIINSAWRSPEHNKDVGGKPNSSHLKGLAVDIKIENSRQRFIVLQSLIAAGFNRIGIGKTFIHVDGDKDKDPRVTWLY